MFFFFVRKCLSHAISYLHIGASLRGYLFLFIYFYWHLSLRLQMRIRAFLLLLCIVVVTSAVPKSLLLRTEWEKYKTTHEKVYSNHEEDRQRMKTYLASRQRVSEHNKRYESGIVSYKIGLNQFSDMVSQRWLSPQWRYGCYHNREQLC